jgi:hypothetical protein
MPIPRTIKLCTLNMQPIAKHEFASHRMTHFISSSAQVLPSLTASQFSVVTALCAV